MSLIFLQTLESASLSTFCALLQVRCLQVGTHYFPEVKLYKTSENLSFFLSFLQWVVNQNKRYCKIREQLSLTHRLVWGEPYAWERWDRL